MISKDNVRVIITLPKRIDTMINDICQNLKISKSEFIKSGVCYFLNDVFTKQEKIKETIENHKDLN